MCLKVFSTILIILSHQCFVSSFTVDTENSEIEFSTSNELAGKL